MMLPRRKRKAAARGAEGDAEESSSSFLVTISFICSLRAFNNNLVRQ
jgi:hypothetical protein